MPFNVVARVKNMTRETKLGLVVSCSFLCLLGVVLALKMTESPEGEQGAEVAAQNDAAPAAPPGEQVAAPLSKPPAPPVATGGAAHPDRKNEPPTLSPTVDKGAIRLTGGAAPAPGSPPSGDKGNSGDKPNPKIKPSDDPGLPGLPPPLAATGGNSAPPLPPTPLVAPPVVATQQGQAGGKTLTWLGSWGPPGAQLTGGAKPPPAKPILTGGAGKAVTGNPAVPPPLPPIPDSKDTNIAGKATGGGGWLMVAALPKAGDVTSPPKNGAAGGGPLPPPPPPIDNKASTPPLPDLPSVSGAGNTGGSGPPPLVPIPVASGGSSGNGASDVPPLPPMVPPEKKDTVPPPPPLPPVAGAGSIGTAGTGKPGGVVPTIEVQGFDTGATGGKSIKVGAVPPAEPKLPIEPRPAPGPAKVVDPIVVGVRPSASVPPLSLPSPPATVRAAQPDVVSYTEESYVAGAGDTFQSISRAKYGTDAYGQALYLFNRSHPLAGDELLQGDTLGPKQTVYVPPHEILESRYADAIKDARSPGKAAVTVGSTSQRADASAAPRSYRVAAGGEKVYDIARNLLGDGNRWVEIQKLNPGWNWEVPLPQGITLQVPADARVPQ